RGFETRGSEDYHLAADFLVAARDSIYKGNALSLAGIRINDDVTHYGIRPQREPACRLGNGKRRRERVKHRAHVASVAAVSAVMTGVPSFHVRLWRSGHHREPHRYAVATELLCASPQEMFATIESHRRHEVSVGQMRESVAITAHADEFFRLRVVSLEIRVRDGPIVSKAVVRSCLEIQIRKPVGHSPPVQSLAADDPRADPHERLAGVGCVRMLVIPDVKMSAEFAGGVFHPLLAR